MSRKRSAYLSLIICVISAVLLIILTVTFPTLFGWLVNKGRIEVTDHGKTVTLVSIAFYSCVPISASALYMLIRLILNILKDRTFTRENVKLLNFLSYCCYAVMLISGAFIFAYYTLSVVTFSMGAIGTLLRVVKNVMQSAVALKEESDLTI